MSVRIKISSEEFPAAEEISGYDDDQEKYPADTGKYSYELPAFAWIFPDIDAVIDNGSKGADERAEACGIGAVYESRKVFRKRIEDNRCGNIGYDLADKNDGYVFMSCHGFLKE